MSKISKIKTIKGYISIIKELDKITGVQYLKGFTKLSEHDKEILLELDAEIANHIDLDILWFDKKME